MTNKSRKKLNILRTKKVLMIKYEAFSIIFERFLLKQIKKIYMERSESDFKSSI